MPRLRNGRLLLLSCLGALCCVAGGIAGGGACDASSVRDNGPIPLESGTQDSASVIDTQGCKRGQPICSNNTAYTCSATGTLETPIYCASTGQVCADGLGCVACVPGTGTCNDNQATKCLPDGSAVISFSCDPSLGMVCSPSGCSGSCADAAIAGTHAGCEFFASVTANGVWRQWFSFGVVVVNTTGSPTNVTVSQNGTTIAQTLLAASDFKVFALPWSKSADDGLKGPDALTDGTIVASAHSVLAPGSAYLIRSDQPIVAMQFSPTEAENNDGVASGCPDPLSIGLCLSYSDASLLLPTPVWSNTHTAVGWHAWAAKGIGDFLSITAQHDLTQVTLSGATSILALAGGGDASTSYSLSRGDVLELFALPIDGNQWAGTLVSSSQPVQVITGSPCADVPDTASSCSHLEETVLPQYAWGSEYGIAAPTSPDGNHAHLVRIHALADNTAVMFDPPAVHSAVTLMTGQSLDVQSTSSFGVYSTQTFAVTQYLVGHDLSISGNPSQSVVIPKSGFLKQYWTATPPGFANQQLAVVAPTGTAVTIDGLAISSSTFAAIGSRGLSTATVAVAPGTWHSIAGEQPIGVQLYGYGQLASFMLPAGVNLGRDGVNGTANK